MEPIKDGVQQMSHEYSPIQKQIIERIRKEFGAKITLSAVPKGVREMDLSVYSRQEKESFNFLIVGGEIETDSAGDLSNQIKKIILEVLGKNPYPPLKNIEIGAVYQHMKTGRNYRLLFESRIEATGSIFLNYQCDEKPDEIIWARPKDEFMDGRFQPVE